MALSEAIRKKLLENRKKYYRHIRIKHSLQRIIYKAFADLNKLVNEDADITIDRILEIYNRSGLPYIDKFNKNNNLKGSAFFFVCKLNQEERNKVLSQLEKKAAIEEAEEISKHPNPKNLFK